MKKFTRDSLSLTILWFCATIGQASEPPLMVGDFFPDFALVQTDGSRWQLSAQAGQPNIVLFWATWCPYCRKLMPGIVLLHETYSDHGLQVVGVNFRDDGDTVAYARKMNIRFNIVLDGDELARRVGVQGTPTVFVLDRAHRIVLRSSDSDPDNPALRAAVESVTGLEDAALMDQEHRQLPANHTAREQQLHPFGPAAGGNFH